MQEIPKILIDYAKSILSSHPEWLGSVSDSDLEREREKIKRSLREYKNKLATRNNIEKEKEEMRNFLKRIGEMKTGE